MLHFGHIADAQFFYRLMPLIHYPVDLLMVHQTERSLQSEPSNIFADFSIAFVTSNSSSFIIQYDIDIQQNPLTRVGRTREGHEIMIRVIVIGNEGHEHLKILRRIASGEHSLYSTNHALPMLAEFQFEDIVFGFFPKVGGSLKFAYDFWPKNSVGDIVDMILQMLEVCWTVIFAPWMLFNISIKALAYLHDLKIAHRVGNIIDLNINVFHLGVRRTHSATTLSSNGSRNRC